MSRVLPLLACLACLGCGSQPVVVEQSNPSAPAEPTFGDLKPVDLSAHGLPIIMDLPDGAMFSDPLPADLEIMAGQDFQIFVHKGHQDLAESKEKEAGPKAFYDFVAVEIDEPNRLVIRADKRGDEVYVIFSNVTIDGEPYSVTNLSLAWLPKSRTHLDWVLRSIDSMRSSKSASQAAETSQN